MLPLLLMIAQDVTGPPGEDAAPVQASDCRAGADEIIVCRSRDEHRLRALPEPPVGEIVPQARARIGRNKIVQARAAAGPIPTAPEPRLMVDLKIDF
jgi:hypothetical protein